MLTTIKRFNMSTISTKISKILVLYKWLLLVIYYGIRAVVLNLGVITPKEIKLDFIWGKDRAIIRGEIASEANV